jgi:two-component system KDP operon response regulator KdpE
MSYSTTATTPQKGVLGCSGRIADSAQVTHPGQDRILLVEDEIPVAGFLRDALTEIGYAVTVAADGTDALARVAEDAPDLVLLDLNLPDIPGVDVLERLCARSSTIRVVIVSGNTDPMMAEAARALGAVAYITKPVELGVLSRVVAMALRMRR